MTSVSRSALMSNDCNQLIVSGVESLPMRSVQDLVIDLSLFFLLKVFGLLADSLLLLLFLFGLILHLLVLESLKSSGVLFFSDLTLEFSAQVQRLFQLFRAEIIHIQNFWE